MVTPHTYQTLFGFYSNDSIFDDRYLAEIGDVIIGAVTALPSFFHAYDFSVPYSRVIYVTEILFSVRIKSFLLQADEIIIVGLPDRLPHWIGMIRIYQPLVWCSAFVFCAFVCCVIRLLTIHVPDEVLDYTILRNIVFNVFAIMINSAPNRVPTTVRIRCIFLLWSFFCLNWLSAYTSSLVSMITTALHTENTVILDLKISPQLGTSKLHRNL